MRLPRLWTAESEHGESVVGILLTSVSLAVMMFLARAKLAAARALGSRAMVADAFRTTACRWIALVTLVGIGMNALFGLWWADPVAALAVAALVAKEGREAWEGRDCCG